MTSARLLNPTDYFTLGQMFPALVDPRADGQDRDALPNQEHIYFSAPDLPAARSRATLAVPGSGPEEIREMPLGEKSFYLTDP